MLLTRTLHDDIQDEWIGHIGAVVKARTHSGKRVNTHDATTFTHFPSNPHASASSSRPRDGPARSAGESMPAQKKRKETEALRSDPVRRCKCATRGNAGPMSCTRGVKPSSVLALSSGIASRLPSPWSQPADAPLTRHFQCPPFRAGTGEMSGSPPKWRAIWSATDPASGHRSLPVRRVSGTC